MEKISLDSKFFATSDSMVEANKKFMTIKAKDNEKGKTFATFVSVDEKVVTLKAKYNEKGKMFVTSDFVVEVDKKFVTLKATEDEKENMKIIANNKGMLHVLLLFFFSCMV